MPDAVPDLPDALADLAGPADFPEARAMWAADAASAALGMHVDHLGAGTARVSMLVRPDMVNGHELCHGGLIASLADSAFALACNSHGPVTVAAGFTVDFLRPGRLGQRLHADAREVSSRGRSGVYDVTVRADHPVDGEVVAEFRGRSRTLADRRA
ncbi:hydroxyphenylacetyl-CoA thioesterase PaaI [Nocardioides oleivorans]|uniref:Hydroxyphenylacetyl-CoA thioesterase PaaI n=1 Tax=Nocardioides oleivorans TaxID=273676 RepID=A0A4Q2RUR2_9ACTN|nr:hydroxyphenylacetyl-CoA thioesterase PaaI [Nocardioides oleivorans]RYB92880.1 hydroxyphenylacetyl-CoA thioesterase PaaI [Nocardioides oleivorans]